MRISRYKRGTVKAVRRRYYNDLIIITSVTRQLTRRQCTVYNNMIIVIAVTPSDYEHCSRRAVFIRSHRALQRTQSQSLASAATILNGKRSATDAVRVTRPGGERVFVCFGLRVSRRWRRRLRRNVILFTSREK